MADYQLTADEHTILRVADQAWIPDDPTNCDYIKYQQWLAAGNTPDPYTGLPLPAKADGDVR